MTKRRRLSRLERVRIFDAHNGICHRCRLKIHAERGEKWEVMHVKSLWTGGKDEPENMAPGHVKCHSEQTRSEAPVRSKSHRVRANYLGIRKPRSITRWRRFDGTPVTATRERGT